MKIFILFLIISTIVAEEVSKRCTSGDDALCQDSCNDGLAFCVSGNMNGIIKPCTCQFMPWRLSYDDPTVKLMRENEMEGRIPEEPIEDKGDCQTSLDARRCQYIICDDSKGWCQPIVHDTPRARCKCKIHI